MAKLALFYHYLNWNFSVAISTIFLSFIEDCEVNDGSPEKPYANKATQKYFGKRVQKLKQKQKGISSSKTELREMSWADLSKYLPMYDEPLHM